MADPTTDMKHDPRRWARRCLILFWFGLLILMHYPQPLAHTFDVHWWDKVGHFVAYSLFTALVCWWVFAGEWPAADARRIKTRGILIVLGVTIYGLCDEWAQPLTGRDFDWWDWAVDALAALLVGTVITMFVLKRARTSEPDADVARL